MVFTKISKALSLAALLAVSGFMAQAQAQDNAAAAADGAPAAEAQAAPADTIDAAAADAALRKRLQSVEAAIGGKSKLAAGNFSEQFLQQSSPEAVQKALDSVRSSVGSCQIVGRMQTPAPVIASVLLGCAKGFVPLELAIEPKAPYRISGILLRPAFWK